MPQAARQDVAQQRPLQRRPSIQPTRAPRTPADDQETRTMARVNPQKPRAPNPNNTSDRPGGGARTSPGGRGREAPPRGEEGKGHPRAARAPPGPNGPSSGGGLAQAPPPVDVVKADGPCRGGRHTRFASAEWSARSWPMVLLADVACVSRAVTRLSMPPPRCAASALRGR
jgi:hypothetical protein